jgi:two-component system, OmpR family, phosphate regulon response regulator PhoB
MPATILLIDSDAAARQLMALNLTQAGHAVGIAHNAEEGRRRAVLDQPDLLLLEWDLPDESGLWLLRRLRAQADIPVIMLTARSAEQDKVLALESGADDYITKPFGPREAIARVHAVLRRRQPQRLQQGGLSLDPRTQRVRAGNCELVLGRLEFRLLNFLMQHPQRVHSRAQLLDQVWGNAVFLDERTVDAHVGRLRSALQPSGHHSQIETVRGSGYRFVA